MASIVKVWVGELSKLREKVLPLKPLFSKAKQGTDQNNKEIVDILSKGSSSSHSSTSMSEETVCLLMNRFVPW
ncbi:hypothetical protein RYX36_036490 [Vicia faba]